MYSTIKIIFRGQFGGELWHSKLLRPSLTTQVQTATCYRETRERCIYVWHYCTCLQVYKLTRRTQWPFSTTRLELFYILHRMTGGRAPRVQESRQCIFAASRCLEINTRVSCYQTELVNWIGMFFKKKKSQVNKLHCHFLSLKNLEVHLGKTGGTVG